MFTQSQYLSDSYFEDSENFSWPVDRNIAVSIRDQFIENLINFYKSTPDFSEFTQYYPVLCIYWSTHMLQSYNAQSLKEANTEHVTLKDPVQNAILEGEAIPEPAYLVQLEKGVHDIKPYLKPVRALKHLILKNGVIKRKPAFLTDFEKDIIVTTTGPIISLHAQEETRDVIYQNQALWFYPLSNIQNLYSAKADKDIDLLWSLVIKSFGDHARFVDEPRIKDWLCNIFQKSLTICHAYTKRLNNNKNKLPKNLWIGTGSALWDRMLKNVVFQDGGHVTGHDHGAGVGHLISKSRTLSECFACHEFVTFGDAKQFKASIFKPFLINSSPEAKHVSNIQDTQIKDIKQRSGNKILILPSAPEAKIPRFIGAAMEPVQADFLNRLFLQLKNDGYDVYIKPHPELEPLIHDEYFIKNGGHVLRETLKEAYGLCDIVLFQHIHSTTFKEAFEHGKHIAFIDMQYDEWTPEAYDTVSKRCSAIPSYYDEKNRIQIDWGNLSNRLENTRSLKDSKFLDMFFS